MKTKLEKKNQHWDNIHANQKNNKLDSKEMNSNIAEKHKNADKNIMEFQKEKQK